MTLQVSHHDSIHPASLESMHGAVWLFLLEIPSVILSPAPSLSSPTVFCLIRSAIGALRLFLSQDAREALSLQRIRREQNSCNVLSTGPSLFAVGDFVIFYCNIISFLFLRFPLLVMSLSRYEGWRWCVKG
jgi:hypothetical protein